MFKNTRLTSQLKDTLNSKYGSIFSVLPYLLFIFVVFTLPAYLFGLVFGLVTQFFMLQEKLVTIATLSRWYVFKCEMVIILAYYILIGGYLAISLFIENRKN